MSQAVLIQQNPVFPLEIFSLIVEIIAKSSPHYPSLGSDEMEKLAACSLTCSSLHELCRPQIFRSISIGFNSRSGKKLLRLTGILKAKPIIKTEIVDVFVSFLSNPWDSKLFEHLEKSAHHPATFPAVQRLSIVDRETYTEGGRIHARGPGPRPQFAQNFCRELIKSYAKLPTLQSFHNERNFRALNIPYIALGRLAGEKMLRLMDLIAANPIIRTDIVDVHISLLCSAWDQTPFNELQLHPERPSKFPAIQQLSIVDGNSYTAGGRTHARPAGSPSWAREFCQVLIESYTKLPTLRSFNNMYNARAENLPYLALGCPTLQLTDLRLVDIADSKVDPDLVSKFKMCTLPYLKRLTIGNCPQTFLSILSQATSLVELTISGDFQRLATLPTPICKLETLNLHPDDSADGNGLSPVFVILWRVNLLGFKPISTLRSLYLGVITPRDLPILNKMFADLGQLQSLTIDALLHTPDDWFSFSEIDIYQHVHTTFSSLTSIAFLFWHQITTTALDSFVSLISSLTNATQLKDINFTISTIINEEGDPLYDDILFPSLTSIISSLLRQSLVEVNIHLKFRLG
ncbi:hypothetical protein CVT24_012130 [Panaeolus cyanescens]|uniref:F-box domain-containing protein n=1 Tax=Panaeolus cyanescens TaxID=181874 RepID=A0A409YYR7_9AGAR|nr:hypothetical protein CVT24_012130 [Panaeolus cyanescens]